MKKVYSSFLMFVGLFTVIIYSGCNSSDKMAIKEPATKEELGAMLFSDPILSQGNQVSCASCHIPDYAFADTNTTSKGVDGKIGTRNSPSTMNLSSRIFFFHDGRAESMEEQAVGPIENPIEMNLPMPEAVKKLNANQNYKSYFKKIYNSKATRENIIDALVSFEKTLETSNSPFDQFMHGDTNAISESAKRGQQIFNVKGKCFDCHFGPDFTGDEFRNIGLYNGKELNDAGRSEITKNKNDVGKFKVSGLRNIAVTGPYMHNGMFKTLEKVIDYYNTPQQFVTGSINADSLLLKPLNLSVDEKSDLLSFLKSLTDERFKNVQPK